jgi:hypothetical protein
MLDKGIIERIVLDYKVWNMNYGISV